jgi:hypothetical protein
MAGNLDAFPLAIICTLWKRDFSCDREGRELDFRLNWGSRILDKNLDEIIVQLKKMPAPYQRDAVELCTAGSETTVDRLISELYLWKNSEAPHSDEFGAFPVYALTILGSLKEKRSHSFLLEIVNLPDASPVVDSLGDYVTERMHIDLYRTSNGDFSGIRKALLNPEANIYARWECIKALEVAAAYKDISIESFGHEIAGYIELQLERFRNRKSTGYEENDYTFAAALLSTLCELNAPEHLALVKRAFSEDILDTSIVSLDCFNTQSSSWRAANFERLKQDCEASVHEALEWWACFGSDPLQEEVPMYFEELFKSKKKKIGRNELCPCGSNKKYKKCCLV